MIKRILVGLTGATPPATVQTAVDLARRHRASISAVTVANPEKLWRPGTHLRGADPYVSRHLQRQELVTEEMIDKAIERISAACVDAQVPFQIAKETGDPLDLLISEARYHDLIVVSLQALFEHEIVRSPQNALIQLIRNGVSPLLATVPAQRDVRRVLIAYSGSMESAATIKRFVQLKPYGQEVELRVVCFKKDDEASKLLQDASDYCRQHGFQKITTESCTDDPKTCFLKYAEEHKADLIVLGNSARNLVVRHVLGSIMLDAIVRSTAPLFLSR